MFPNRKAQLIEALRSGKYPKATGRLRVDDSFCCLGVACELAKDDVGGQWVKYKEDGAWHWHDDSETNSITGLTSAVKAWLGVGEDYTSELGRWDDTELLTITSTNDRADTFEPVIERLEKEY